jgi:hypothetical protein
MAEVYNFPPITKGNTFTERKIWLYDDDAGTFPTVLTGATICMQLKYSDTNGVAAHEFAYTITDAVNGEITLTEWEVDLKPYAYVYDMLVTFADGDKKTFLKGSFKVTQNISEC